MCKKFVGHRTGWVQQIRFNLIKVFRCGYRISIRGYVRPSVRLLVRLLVRNAFVKMAKSVRKSAF